MPKIFINTDKFLLHSSCVLDGNKNAYFCLGPSGAGKTTIASLVPRNRVLGDDMNVIKLQNGRCWAQAGALGQAISNPEEYSSWHPVTGALWLEQSSSIEFETLRPSDQLLKISSAVANVFWSHLPEHDVQRIFSVLGEILRVIEVKKLSFNITRDVWPAIWNHYLKESGRPCAL